MLSKKFDRIIIGAGIYGLYAALKSVEKGLTVAVLEYDEAVFMRGTYINQARVHNGYHYPRSRSTATKSRDYFERFIADYPNAIHKDFRKVYAISKEYSWTNGAQFEKFCADNEIPYQKIPETLYFEENSTDGVYDTLEYTFDAKIIGKELLEKCEKFNEFSLFCSVRTTKISHVDNEYHLSTNHGEFQTPYLLNASYASTNQILDLLGFEKLNIKYELCEIILCSVSKNIKDVGLTVMDGPFFSVMPFGKTGYHSLTSVTFTPHMTSYDSLPTFSCQKKCTDCSPQQLSNCNTCPCKPKTAWPKMLTLAQKYLSEEIEIKYVKSLFTIKPILKVAEIDDSRPTIIKQYSHDPTFITVFSGKINTIYDLDEIL